MPCLSWGFGQLPDQKDSQLWLLGTGSLESDGNVGKLMCDEEPLCSGKSPGLRQSSVSRVDFQACWNDANV